MSSILLGFIICPILFGITFFITTGFFIYKLIKSQNDEYFENTTIRTISISSAEVSCCMDLIWHLCLNKTTNRMALSTFIIWYIVSVCLQAGATIALFFILFEKNINLIKKKLLVSRQCFR